MVEGIRSHGGPAWSDSIQQGRRGHGWRRQIDSGNDARPAAGTRARASTLDSQISRTGALQVTTDDGDSVTISFAALDQLHAESFRGQSGDSRLAYGSASTESGVAIDIKVDGSLDSGEVADITALLGQLAQAIHDPGKSPVSSQFADGGSFDSLSSFQFGYQERAQTAVSSSAVLTA